MSEIETQGQPPPRSKSYDLGIKCFLGDYAGAVFNFTPKGLIDMPLKPSWSEYLVGQTGELVVSRISARHGQLMLDGVAVPVSSIWTVDQVWQSEEGECIRFGWIGRGVSTNSGVVIDQDLTRISYRSDLSAPLSELDQELIRLGRLKNPPCDKFHTGR